MLRKNLAAHHLERHAVEILIIADLNATEFKAHHGRIVAHEVADIAAPFLITPAKAVEWVVLMPEHYAFLRQARQAGAQLLRRGRSLGADGRKAVGDDIAGRHGEGAPHLVGKQCLALILMRPKVTDSIDLTIKVCA